DAALVAASRAASDDLLLAADGCTVDGQVMLADKRLRPRPVQAGDHGDVARRVAGQLVAPAGGGATAPLDVDDGTPISSGARAIVGQTTFATPELTAAAAPAVTEDGYQIGEEHPEIQESDALFEARQALELGALELTMGRLSSQQLAGYRLLAESTMPYVAGETFVDAAQYTETNATFHDYLFTLTGNDHLLQAYRALGVKGRMNEVLRNATWCHPLCAQDHMDIVTAFETGDRDGARALIVAHADRSKQTMRRAWVDGRAARHLRFITPGRFDGKVVILTGAAQGIGEQTARRIAAEGGTLVLADRSELVKQLATELAGDGRRALAVVADFERYDGAESAAQHAISEFGRIDV